MTKLIKASGPSRRGIVKAAGALAAGIAAPALLRVRPAYAAYPDRTVKIVVANTPGGPSDIIGRLVAAGLQQSTGKTFIIENHGGAGGNIGMEYAARSEPDGYTILLATNAYSINYGLYNAIPYDPFKDFVPVCELGGSPNIFVVKSDLPAKTMKEFIALARANPEKFNASTSPIGTTPQLQLEVLKSRENLPKLELVVFKGGGDAIEALLAGTVQMCSGSLAPSQPHIKSGALRGLAICAEQRWTDLPDVPTMAEAGYKDFVFARRRRAAGAGQDAAGQCQMAGGGNAEGFGHAGNERQVLPGRLLRARQGRRRGLGARDQGDYPVQRGHRSGRHQEAVATSGAP